MREEKVEEKKKNRHQGSPHKTEANFSNSKYLIFYSFTHRLYAWQLQAHSPQMGVTSVAHDGINTVVAPGGGWT